MIISTYLKKALFIVSSNFGLNKIFFVDFLYSTLYLICITNLNTTQGSQMDNNNRSWLGLSLLGLLLAVGIIISTFVISNTVERVKTQNQRITVKGFAERTITSDIAVWEGQITARSSELVTAYDNLQADLQKVLSYLKEQGVQSNDISMSAVTTRIQYRRTDKGGSTNIVDGYVLVQNVKISSSNIEQVAGISSSITDLIKEGIEFDSFAPRYFYTKLDDIKIELLGEATKNAGMRASSLAENSGSKVGALKYASQGVFQITPLYSTEVSGYGVYDTSTIEKSVKAVVTIEYSIR